MRAHGRPHGSPSRFAAIGRCLWLFLLLTPLLVVARPGAAQDDTGETPYEEAPPRSIVTRNQKRCIPTT